MPTRLTELYNLHKHKCLPRSDPRWAEVQSILAGVARKTCENVKARSHQGALYGAAIEQRYEDIYTALLTKFLERRLNHNRLSIEPLLSSIARNELATSFRRGRSPSAVYFEGAEETWEGDQGPRQQNGNLFETIRDRLPAFRFQEYPHVREALLAFFLMTNRYPGHHFLHAFGVRRDERVAVYNAALYDINGAMIGHFDEPAVA
jgi:hypothetical protein